MSMLLVTSVVYLCREFVSSLIMYVYPVMFTCVQWRKKSLLVVTEGGFLFGRLTNCNYCSIRKI